MHEEVSAREVPALVNVLQTRPLQFSTSDTNVVPATPVKRRGKCMSRRTGQDVHIEASGKWWVVRWWMDVAGLETRKHMRAKELADFKTAAFSQLGHSSVRNSNVFFELAANFSVLATSTAALWCRECS